MEHVDVARKAVKLCTCTVHGVHYHANTRYCNKLRIITVYTVVSKPGTTGYYLVRTNTQETRFVGL